MWHVLKSDASQQTVAPKVRCFFCLLCKPVVYDHLMFFFFGLLGLSAHYLLGNNFVYWNWIVSLPDKNIDFFLNKSLI